MSEIVVGVDGSDASKAALRWALGEARLRSCGVRAVCVWLFPSFVSSELGLPTLPTAFEHLRDDAKTVLAAAVTEVAGESPDVEIEQVVAEGPEAHALVEAAADADLLVVGSRGRGGFAGLLLGSVSQQCAQHAPCPIVIVRPEPQR